MEMSKTGVIRPQKIDTLRPINQRNFFQWKTVLMSFLKTNNKYVPFLAPTKTWPCLNDDVNRGEAADNINVLDCLITALASYGPESLIHDIINECTSVQYFFDRICELFSLKNSGSTIFQYSRMRRSFKHDGKKTYQDLRATRYETPLKKNCGVKYKGADVGADEKMTAAVENGIVMDWLEGVDERLPAYVEQKYAIELQSVTLKDLQSEISKHLDSHLTDIKAMRTQVQKEAAAAYDDETTDSDEGGAVARFVRKKFYLRNSGFRKSERKNPAQMCHL